MVNPKIHQPSDMESDDDETKQVLTARKSPRLKSTSATSPSVLSSTYLQRYSNKNDLVRRLRTIVDALSNDDVECNSPEYPGLDSLAALLVEDEFLLHRDKEVRLYTVLACMEIFCVYVPNPPWDESEILKIFPQVIRQLANLAVCTSPSQPLFTQYFHLLEQLAEVKIGVVLVEMIRTLDAEPSPLSSTLSPSSNYDRKLPSSGEALEVLTDLVKTIIHSVHIDHPSEVTSHAVSSISACIEEFDGGMIPIPILDEILLSISSGPVIYVTNPAFVEATAKAASSKKKGGQSKASVVDNVKLPPMSIQQTNQSYMVAASILRKTEDRISTPIASLLNGLLNGQSHVIEKTNILPSAAPGSANSGGSGSNGLDAGGVCGGLTSPPIATQSGDVWTIIYELHKISPRILTTVIGNVATSLTAPSKEKRLQVTKLLGRLFYSRSSDIAVRFHACYKEWTRRSSDVDSKIRLTMVKYLIAILTNKGNESTLCDEATDVLVQMVTQDPSADVRLLAIHEICDLAHNQSGRNQDGGTKGDETVVPVSARLLKAVGNRVSSKNKIERRDAVTGLARIYYRHYILEKLKQIQNGGDDCDIKVILDAIHSTGCYERDTKRKSLFSPSKVNRDVDDLEEKYNFIPKLVFESACFTDATDPEMRNRVVQIIDDVLLGSGVSSSDEGRNEKKKIILSPTSRAVGLVIIMNSLLDTEDMKNFTNSKSNAYRWMISIFTHRAKLQRAVKAYIDARGRVEQLTNGEEKLSAQAIAWEKLEYVASLSPRLSLNDNGGSPPDDVHDILTKVHGAKDKHIFRLLASISSPTHSASARSRAFDDLPKRAKSLGESAASWIKCLARRTAMGHFVNTEIITHAILLAQEAFHQQDLNVSISFLNCIKSVVEVYPNLVGTQEGFGTLVELLGECRGSYSSTVKRQIDDSGIITTISSILALSAPSRAAIETRTENAKDNQQGKASASLDPELQDQLITLCTKDGTPEQARHAIFTLAALLPKSTHAPNQRNESCTEDHTEVFNRLLKTLTSSSRMCLTCNGKPNEKIVTVLAALTALVQCCPNSFCGSGDSGERGAKAIRFALETILLGRGDTSDDKVSSDDDCVAEEKILSPKDTKLSTRRKSGNSDNNVSLECKRACFAIELLVTHIRSSITYSMQESKSNSIKEPTPSHIATLFDTFVNIIQDSGLPPSSRDRKECKGIRDRAALRECAAVSILRLCDRGLNLESKYFTSKMWHMLGGVFLDEEVSVREAVMDELSMMLTGTGLYRHGSVGVAPSLRFLAYITLCPDLDNHCWGANANAAKVGRKTEAAKAAALQCVTSLRRTCEATALKCRAISRQAEKNFETNLKMLLMPELAVSYAFHLLTFRPETPYIDSTSPENRTRNNKDDSYSSGAEEEAKQKILQKRLRWLFHPLVNSLGEGADNISFLLRLTELLGNKYRPVDIFSRSHGSSDSDMDDSLLENMDLDDNDSRNEKSVQKLKVICENAREVLLKFVKKDVNLTPYPGSIQIPGSLYLRLPKSNDRVPEKLLDSNVKSKSDLGTPLSIATNDTSKTNRVHFSPDTKNPRDIAQENDDSLISWDDSHSIPTSSLQLGTPVTSKVTTKGIPESRLHLNLSPIPQSGSPTSTPESPTPEPSLGSSKSRNNEEPGYLTNRRSTRLSGQKRGMTPMSTSETPAKSMKSNNDEESPYSSIQSSVGEETSEGTIQSINKTSLSLKAKNSSTRLSGEKRGQTRVPVTSKKTVASSNKKMKTSRAAGEKAQQEPSKKRKALVPIKIQVSKPVSADVTGDSKGMLGDSMGKSKSRAKKGSAKKVDSSLDYFDFGY